MSTQTCAFPYPSRSEAILAVCLSTEDHGDLKSILAGLHWTLTRAQTLAEAVRETTSGSVPVVVCERDLPDGGWKMLLDRVGELARPPQLIVSSRHADDRLWAEVLNLGGYDALAIPFDPDEVCRVLSRAVDSWHTRAAAAKKT